MQNDDFPEIKQPAPAKRFLAGVPVPRLLTQTGGLFRALIDLPFRFIFGRDVFISYSRRDARRYAPNLTLALQKRMPKLSVYLDRWIAPPSGKLPLSLRLQLRWSSILVVVCTEKAVGSDFVKDEVANFARLRRKVVTVDVDGAYSAVRGQMPWLEVSGADPEEESRDAVEHRFGDIDCNERSAWTHGARKRAARHGWANVELVQSDAAAFQYPAQLDAVLSTYTLVILLEYDRVIERAFRALKEGKRCAVLDQKLPSGPASRLVPLLDLLSRRSTTRASSANAVCGSRFGGMRATFESRSCISSSYIWQSARRTPPAYGRDTRAP